MCEHSPRLFMRSLIYFLGFCLLTLLLVLFELPVEGFAGKLVQKSLPARNTTWSSLHLSIGSPPIMHNLEMSFSDGSSLRASTARIQMEWFPLLLGKIRLRALDIDTLEMRIPPISSEGLLEINEATLARPLLILEDLQRALSPGKFSLTSRETLLFMGPKFQISGPWQIDCSPCLHKPQLQINISRLRLNPLPPLEEIKFRLNRLPQSLQIKSALKMAGGSVRVKGNIPYPKFSEGSSFTLKVKELNSRPILATALPATAQLKGALFGNLHWQGQLGNIETWQGRGTLKMQEMQIINWPFQQDENFRQLTPGFDTISLAYLRMDTVAIQGQNILLGGIRAHSRDIQFGGSGTFTLPHDLKLRLQGTLSPARTQQLPIFTRMTMGVKNADAAGQFNVVLSGTWQHHHLQPTAKHIRQAIDGKLRQVGEGLQKMFGK